MKFKVDFNGGGNALTAQLVAEARHKLAAALEHMAAERSARARADGQHQPSRRADKRLRRGVRAAIAPRHGQEGAASDDAKSGTDGSRGAT